MSTTYVPAYATRMELFVTLITLRRIRDRILKGHPSGQVINQAIEETFNLGTTLTSERTE